MLPWASGKLKEKESPKVSGGKNNHLKAHFQDHRVVTGEHMTPVYLELGFWWVTMNGESATDREGEKDKRQMNHFIFNLTILKTRRHSREYLQRSRERRCRGGPATESTSWTLSLHAFPAPTFPFQRSHCPLLASSSIACV